MARPVIEPLPPELVLTPRSRWPLELPEATVRAVRSRPLPAGAHPAGSRRPHTSVVVVTFDNLVFTRLCLESVLTGGFDRGAELIVVDNASSDGTPEYLRRLAAADGRVRAVFNDTNRGFAPAANQGLALARGRVLVLLNNDTMVAPGWLTGLRRHLTAPAVGLVGPVTNRSGNQAQVETEYQTHGGFLREARARARTRRGQARAIPVPLMFCVAMRRDVWAEVGPLDERFEVGLFEDEDYALRVRAAGYRLHCAEDVLVHHFGQASLGKLAADGAYGALFHANRRRFEDKWGRAWKPHRHRPNRGYGKLLAAIRDAVRRVVPERATVLVVSRGDEDLLALDGRAAWHFPQDEYGQYAGHHPADGESAIAHLETLRCDGAQYLLLPATAFWWLEHYPEFARHLAARYACVRRDDDCVIHRLAEPVAARPDPIGPEPEFSGRPLEGHGVTVLVVAPQDPARLQRCLSALLRHTTHPHRLLLVDDATEDPAVRALIQTWVERHRHVCALRLPIRRGYAAALAAGCRRAGGDVALVDPATGVAPGWLEQLAARAVPADVAAVAALFTAARPPAEPARAIFALQNPVSSWAKVQAVPIAGEHCLYLPRRALNRLGFFDPERFPGPEAVIDFSLRAQARGLRVLADQNTVVAFDPPAAELDAQALEAAHPGYAERIARWLAADPPAGRRTRPPGTPPEDRRRTVLAVVHDGSGGAVFAAEDLAGVLGQDYRVLLLKSALDRWTVYRIRDGALVPERRYAFAQPWRLHEPLDEERRGVLAALCEDFRVELVHLHHLLGSGPDLPLTISRRGLPVVFSGHDFFSICPTAHLLDHAGRYCAGTCTPGAGECLPDRRFIDGPLPVLKHHYVLDHRERMAAALECCAAVVVPSASAADLLTRFFPRLEGPRLNVIGPGRDLARCALARAPRRGKPARVICPGHLDRVKGAALIAELQALNAAAGAPFEFHFLGRPAPDLHPEHAGGICHGEYRRDELPALIGSIRPSFALLASICAETWSFTLSECWAAGVPVFATDLGALRERIAAHGGGWCFPPVAGVLFDGMRGVLADPAEYRRQSARIASIPLPDLATSAARVAAVYRAALAAKGERALG